MRSIDRTLTPVLREFPLPPGQEDRVAAWSAQSLEATPAREAATVLLVRDGDRGVEVFLLRRHLSMAFAGGMYAFPGGGVDPRDAADDVPWAGPDAAEWATWLHATAGQARAFVCAAVRETFEECGVLLAAPAGGSDLLPDVDDGRWETERRRLVARETALSEVLRERDLVLRSDLLRPWAHWTTPAHEPRRFDTRFLISLLPPGQSARHVHGGESAESGWWPATDVLDRHARGEVAMLPPTLVALEEAAAAPDATTLWRSPRVLREVMPTMQRRDGQVVLVADLPEQP